MKNFKSFEELNTAYPIDEKTNTYHTVSLDYTHVLTDADMGQKNLSFWVVR